MWMMIQADKPGDYVVATGEAHSVRDFLDIAADRLGIMEEHVEIDPRYYRPTEVDYLLGDASRARTILGWHAETSFEQLVNMMVDSDLAIARREKVLRESGFAAMVR